MQSNLIMQKVKSILIINFESFGKVGRWRKFIHAIP